MSIRFIDLHSHSTASDGSDTPAELVRKAAAARLAAIALTDHDTTSGLDEAVREGRRLGLEVIRGCELGVRCEHGELHILCAATAPPATAASPRNCASAAWTSSTPRWRPSPAANR